MALNFPNSPSLNDLHEENLTKWRWNGSSWIRVVTTSTAGAQGFQGAAGAQGATAAQGAQGDDGAQGAQGHQGATGSGAQGNAGAQGAQGAQGLNGNFGGASFEYTFLTNTTDSDPGAGSLKFNNSNLTSASILYIDDTDGGSSNTDIQPFLRTIDDSTSTIKGHVKISTKTNPDQFVLYTIASLVEATGYFKVTVAYVSGSVTSFSNSSDVSITFARTGDAGSTGAQGAQGHQGASGSAGAQGAGNTGAQGAQGHQGLQGAQAHISTSAPSSGVTVGDLWWESDSGDLSIYYNDGNSNQWVEVGAMGPTGAQGATAAAGAQGAQGHQGAAGGAGAQGAQGNAGAQGDDANLATSTSAPSSPSAGDMWWDSDDANLYVYYNDGSSSQWVSVNTGVRGAQGAQGHQGAAGAQGAQGHQGANGAQGAAGAQGAQGHQGAAGAQGSAGAQGNQGATGSATISSNSDNRVITGGSGTNLVGESNLIFDGTRLQIASTNNSASGTRLVVGSGNNISATALINTQDTDINALTLSNWDGATTSNKVLIGFDNSGRGSFSLGMPAATNALAFLGSIDGSSNERLRITSTGQLKVGNNPTINSGDFAHIEAPTSFNSGETIITIAGDSSTTGPRLNLQNKNTGANACSEVLGADAGGQSTSYLRFNHTDQTNNYGEISFGTRNAQGTPPVERLRITRQGVLKLSQEGNIQDGSFYSSITISSPNGVYQGLRFDRGTTAKWRIGMKNDDTFQIANLFHDGSAGAEDNCVRITDNDDISITGNLKFSTAGKGIDFSSTGDGSSSMSSELLDDYEEGTWTASISGGSFITTNGAYYTKIGRMVYWMLHCTPTFAQNDTSPYKIYGLPYTSANVTQNYGWSGNITYTQSGNNTTIANMRPLVEKGDTYIYFHTVGQGSATRVANNLIRSSMLNQHFLIGGFYMTA